MISDLLQFQFFYDGLMLLLLGGAFSHFRAEGPKRD